MPGLRSSTTHGALALAGRALSLAAFLPVASRAPMYGRLIWELVRDGRTPPARKALLAGAAGYFVLGRDLIPDDIPIVGGIDDLIVVILAVELFLDGVPEELLDEKLEALGIDRDAFDRDISRIRRLTPRPVRRFARRLPDLIDDAAALAADAGFGRSPGRRAKEGPLA